MCYTLSEVIKVNNIGDRLALLRKTKKISQKELASTIFVSDKTISSWEMNRTSPNLEDIVKLSDALDTTCTYLLYGDIDKLDVEIEIKIRLTEEEYNCIDSKMIKEAEFLKEIKQKDTYYNPEYRSFLNDSIISEWLRIGERGGKIILNYKHWYNIHCDEFEVEIDNKSNLEKIFKVLGLKKIAIVDKLRKTYFYNDKYEVALDKVENLGYFIEIEVKNYDDTILNEYDKLLKLAKNLGLNLAKIDKRGYPYYFLNLKNNK